MFSISKHTNTTNFDEWVSLKGLEGQDLDLEGLLVYLVLVLPCCSLEFKVVGERVVK